MDQCATIREPSLAEREIEIKREREREREIETEREHKPAGKNPSRFNREENVHQSFPSV